jgi:arabinofuranosyltransferase
LTLSVIVFGAILALFTRSYRQALFCAGALLYLGYVVYVGGDYMSGRFLSAPFFLVVLALLSMQLGWSYILFSVFGLLALAFGPRSVLLMAEPYVCRIEDNWRIADQRIRYGPWTSPRAYLKNGRSNTHFLQMRGIELKDNSNKVIRSKAIGMQGVVLGPERTIIDPYALADPLLARLPISHPHKWRIGHFNRAMPDGYIESLETLENRILDPALHEYYDKLSLIVRGDLFSLQRLKTIVAFNLGRYEPLRLAYVSRMNRPTQNGVRRRLSVPALGARGLSCSL